MCGVLRRVGESRVARLGRRAAALQHRCASRRPASSLPPAASPPCLAPTLPHGSSSGARLAGLTLARRMPRPPPPAVALIMMGKPTWRATLSASSSDRIRPSEPGTVGTPAACTRARAGVGRAGWWAGAASMRCRGGGTRAQQQQQQAPAPAPAPAPSHLPTHLHGVARRRLVSHHADRVRLGAAGRVAGQGAGGQASAPRSAQQGRAARRAPRAGVPLWAMPSKPSNS